MILSARAELDIEKPATDVREVQIIRFQTFIDDCALMFSWPHFALLLLLAYKFAFALSQKDGRASCLNAEKSSAASCSQLYLGVPGRSSRAKQPPDRNIAISFDHDISRLSFSRAVLGRPLAWVSARCAEPLCRAAPRLSARDGRIFFVHSPFLSRP